MAGVLDSHKLCSRRSSHKFFFTLAEEQEEHAAMWQNPPHESMLTRCTLGATLLSIPERCALCELNRKCKTLFTSSTIRLNRRAKTLLAHHEAMTECLRPDRAGSLSNIFSSSRRLEPEVEIEN